MLLVDHDMGLVLGVCDYVYVLEFGKVIAHGKPDEVRNDPAVIEAYLGSGDERQQIEEMPGGDVRDASRSSRSTG